MTPHANTGKPFPVNLVSVDINTPDIIRGVFLDMHSVLMCQHHVHQVTISGLALKHCKGALQLRTPLQLYALPRFPPEFVEFFQVLNKQQTYNVCFTQSFFSKCPAWF
jgi:hypothetical protein